MTSSQVKRMIRNAPLQVKVIGMNKPVKMIYVTCAAQINNYVSMGYTQFIPMLE